MTANAYAVLRVSAMTLLLVKPVFAHDASEHLDPELLSGWVTWMHLTFQWAHLIGFALWFGLLGGALLLKLKTRLDHLLYSSWFL